MIVAIVQARMGSTRLPGKILKEVNGMPLLKYQIDRIKRSNLLNKIVIATSTLEKDDVIENFCKENDIKCFRGSEDDVLDRYYQCAKKYNADIIVRLTADCPLSDPEVINDTIRLFIEKNADYVANTVPPKSNKYPNGSDVEIFSMEALKRAHKECSDLHDKEHVTFYFWKYENDFKIFQLDNKYDWSGYRFTVDYPEDLEVVKFITRELNKRNSFGHLEEIIDIVEANPEIKAKNSHYYSGIGWNK